MAGVNQQQESSGDSNWTAAGVEQWQSRSRAATRVEQLSLYHELNLYYTQYMSKKRQKTGGGNSRRAADVERRGVEQRQEWNNGNGRAAAGVERRLRHSSRGQTTLSISSTSYVTHKSRVERLRELDRQQDSNGSWCRAKAGVKRRQHSSSS